MDEKVLEERAKTRVLGTQTRDVIKAETISDCDGDVQKAMTLLAKVCRDLSMNENE